MNLSLTQLIRAARIAAKYLPTASAGLMNELATRLDVSSVALREAMAERSSLVAENVRLKAELEAENNG